MKNIDVWLNNFNGHPIIIFNYAHGVQAITSRRAHCDFVAIIGHRREHVRDVLSKVGLTSPVVAKNGNYVAVISKGEYYASDYKLEK